MAVNAVGVESSTYLLNGSTSFEAPSRYTVLESVGHGAYGLVVSAEDLETQETVAIKKIENALERTTFARRTLRELKILRHLRHENLIDIREVYLPGSRDDFEDIYIISELMETDLNNILKSPQPIEDEHCQFFLYQILRGLKYLHSAGVIHRDLKPRNLLVNTDCALKICDFGLARLAYPDSFHRGVMTEYVCTRWYRAPEVLCSWEDYGRPIDIWSVGCIFAEMLNRRPIFPGRSTRDQLQLVVSVLGTPDQATLTRIPNERCREFIGGLPVTEDTPLETIIPNASQEALAFLYKTLRINPDHRATVAEAIALPYMFPLHEPEDEPVREPLDPSDFEFERRRVDLQALRTEIFAEMLRFLPTERRRPLEEALLPDGDEAILRLPLLRPGEAPYSDDEEGQ